MCVAGSAAYEPASRWLTHTGSDGSTSPTSAAISAPWSAGVPTSGGWMLTPTTSSPAPVAWSTSASNVGAGAPVALHRRCQLDEDPAVPAGERGDVGRIADREDRAHPLVRAATTSAAFRVGVSTTGVTADGELVEFVHGADGDRVGELGGRLGEPRPTEPVSVALHDGDEPLHRTGNAGDMAAPQCGADGQSHARRPYLRCVGRAGQAASRGTIGPSVRCRRMPRQTPHP